MARELIEQAAATFQLNFAKPYLTEILNSDAALRSDWVVYEGLCRHKINVLEIQARRESQRRTVFHQETDQRADLRLDEMCCLERSVLTERERIGLIAIAAAGRAALFTTQENARAGIVQLAFEKQRDIGLRTAKSVDTFISDGDELSEEYWLHMLRFYDKSVNAALIAGKW